MFPILMAVFFALFGITMLLRYSGQAVAAPGEAPGGQAPAESAVPGEVPAKVAHIINERIAQLDEKLVDLHTRTASQLKAAVDEAEERLRDLEKDVSSKLADAAANAGSGVSSTSDIPDIKRIMHERMEQFDSKLIDMHSRVAKRLDETAKEVEEKLRGQAKDLSATIPDMPVPAGGAAPPPVDSAKLEKFMQERMEQFDEKIIDMHTRIAKRLEAAAEEQEKKIQGMGMAGGAAEAGGGVSEDRIREIEEKIEILAAQGAPAAGGGDPEVRAKIGELEEKVKRLAAAGPPASADAGGAAAVAPMPDLDQLMQERMEQFDAKIIDMHTRIARRLEETAQEQEKKIKGMGGAAVEGAPAEGAATQGAVSEERIKGLEEKIEQLAAQGPPAAAGDAPDLQTVMKERMEQFDEKIIDMHTRTARRLQEAAEEQEKKIAAMGDEVGKTLSDRIAALEEKMKLLVEMVNEKGST